MEIKHDDFADVMAINGLIHTFWRLNLADDYECIWSNTDRKIVIIWTEYKDEYE